MNVLVKVVKEYSQYLYPQHNLSELSLMDLSEKCFPDDKLCIELIESACNAFNSSQLSSKEKSQSIRRTLEKILKLIYLTSQTNN
jgi:hypothetical protein